ncbi:MAG TPA: creatininase family protein [Armatimonadota bacterium]|jgi:creatinine amidohydrolase
MELFTARNTAFEVEQAGPGIGLLPIGATEQHSRHLPLLTDTLLADSLSARILRATDYPGSAYLLPTLPVSSSEENTGYAGALNFTPLTLRAIIRDLYDSLARAGMQRCIICAWHGGNFILKPVIRELNHELGAARLLYLNPFEHLPAEMLGEFAGGFEFHAGEVETSIMLAIDPAGVSADCRDNPQPFHPGWLDLHSMKTLTNGEGHAGHPTRASAEKGRRIIEAMIKGSAEYLKATLGMAERYEGY